MSKRYSSLHKNLFVLFFFSGFHAIGQPKITAVNPSSGPVGSTVTITGSGFNASTFGNVVYFGAVQAVVTHATAGSLTATVPAGSTYQPVSVLNTANGFTGYSGSVFIPTFSNPFGTGIRGDYYKPKINFPTGTAPVSTAIADVDGDGKPDLITLNSSNLSVLRNISSGKLNPSSFASPVDFAVSLQFGDLKVADLDGDGKLDLLVSQTSRSGLYDNRILILHNTSTTGVIAPSSFAAVVLAGSNLRDVTTGDIDGDGKLDLVGARGRGTGIVIMRNTSMPGNLTAASFQAPVNFPFSVSSGPVGVAVIDLDGDGKADVATANIGNNMVSVLRNTAVPGIITDSSLGAPVNFSGVNGADLNLNSIYAADMDLDGKVDLITGSIAASSIAVLRNTSTVGKLDASSFARRVDLATPYNSSLPIASVAIADLDGDGKPDLVSGNARVASVFRNVSVPGSITSTSFAPRVEFPGGAGIDQISTGDLDNDGVPEIVSIDSNSQVAVLTINTPSHPPAISSFSPAGGPVGTAVTLSGFNFNPLPSNNTVYFGAVKAAVTGGSSTSLTVTVPAGATYQPVSVLNNAAGLTGYSAGSFTPTFANPFGTSIPAQFYQPKIDFSTPGNFTYAVALGDLDGDGKPELVSVNEAAGAVSVMRNISATGTITAGSFAGRIDFATAPLPRDVKVRDWDGDGKLDLLVLSPASNTVSVLRNTATPGAITAASFAAPRLDLNIGLHISSFAVADVDQDGKPDLVLTLPYSNTVAVVLNTTVSFGVTYFSMPTGEYPRSVAVSDVDGDGKPDIVVANERSNSVSVIRHNGRTTALSNNSYAPRIDWAAGSNPVGVDVRDVDNDGKPDIVVANFTSSNISVLRNMATADSFSATSFAGKVEYATGLNPYALALGDADGDGKPDLVTANTASNTVSVLRNTTTTGNITASSFANRTDFGAGIYPLGIALGDLDADGIPELAAANAGSGAISVFKINGGASMPTAGLQTGSSMAEAVLHVFPNPTRGEFTLQLQGLHGTVAQIEILDVKGNSIQRQFLNTDGKAAVYMVRVNQQNRPAGIYYVKVTSIEGVRVVKLVVQR